MMRVLWKLPTAKGWTGGLNYFANLARALRTLSERSIQPVVFDTAPDRPAPLDECPAIPRPPAPSPWSWSGLRGRLQPGFIYERHLRAHRIDVASHLAQPPRGSHVPFAGWIPDFQHRHLPDFFSHEERRRRDERHARMAAEAQLVMLSSVAVRADYARFHPAYVEKARVLRFAVFPPVEPEPVERTLILARLGITRPYFHVPNQLWAHKNHALVAEALLRLRARGACPLVVSTGAAADGAGTEHAGRLRARVSEIGLEDHFRFLGLLDHRSTFALMRESIAVINPSRFEGWSTSVEEARSMGKSILLSDLPVHSEQDPPRAAYFSPDDADGLASCMAAALDAWNPDEEQRAAASARERVLPRVQAFAQAYASILDEALVGCRAG
ncbi:MAG TPA: glycosyltransferase family 1 protein [Kiritimatiellia bacterium]|nr:glycosyltransferase family 1 protein [Kiritimatiellia bacterium]